MCGICRHRARCYARPVNDDHASAKREAELAAADAEIRAAQEKLDEMHVKLYTAATVTLELLREQIVRAKGAITMLDEVDADWAHKASGRLQVAILEATINRGDREANMLLTLPQQTEEALAKWVRDMRLGDSNSEALVAACRYALTRNRTLGSIINPIASELSAMDSEPARTSSLKLRERATHN